MAMEHLPLEDVFPTGTGDFPYKILNFVAERSCGPSPWKSCMGGCFLDEISFKIETSTLH